MVDCRDCFGTLQEPTDPVYNETHPKCSRAELDEAGYEPTICPDPNYPTDENGYYKDPYPQRQRAPPTPECKTGTIDRKVKFIFLKPQSPEPSGLLTVIEKRPPQPSPPPRKKIWCPSQPPQKPPPIIIRTPPPKPPPPLEPRTCEVTVPPLRPPPQSVEKHSCAYPTPPPDIIVEQWLPYGPRPPRPIKVIRAPCPPPAEPLHNICIIHDAPEARIEHLIEESETKPGDPIEYVDMYGSTLLDRESLRKELFALLRNTHADEDFLRRIEDVILGHTEPSMLRSARKF
ncbi:unnamed protein product [Rotaria magnacalcarata]|uniref:Uncharacterized protein n=2 Tax=Rotaria magnacalcarata TaxID=392030 RepID=A0A816MCP6_9BILA|nr:unnamed protein product [Rotaria magnacalcarata]